MFNTETVFILGAGASWHYGYPTGEVLVRKVIDKATLVARYFKHSQKDQNSLRPKYIIDKYEGRNPHLAWDAALNESEKLKAALVETDPLVIDYFLGWNPDLREIGTMLIAWVILECERRAQTLGNINRREYSQKDNWCRFVTHQLAINCKKSSDLLLNKVTFITFNYDISLEQSLHKGLQHIQLFENEDVKSFFSSDRFLHIYGAIRPEVRASKIDFTTQDTDTDHLSWEEKPAYQTNYRELLDQIYEASRGLRVIDPHNKGADQKLIETARRAILAAKSVYILGYGFDENNSERLGLRQSLDYEANQKSVYFTNFGNINRVNKRASKLFFGNDVHFPPGEASIETAGHCIFERSVRDVYEALEFDFESFK